MDKLIKHIADIIRPRCISDSSATLAAIDVVTWINDSRNKCECPNEIKTGWITQKVCNICGRPEKELMNRISNVSCVPDLAANLPEVWSRFYKEQTCDLCGSRIDDVRGCVGCGHIVE